MDAPFGKRLKITSIDSRVLIADDKWKMGFIGNAPVGWRQGETIRLSESPKLGAKGGSSEISSSRVRVENLDKKSAPITVSWEGSIAPQKSLGSSSEVQLSLRKNIRPGRELTIVKTFPNYVIQLSDGTKWQLYKDSGRYREINWGIGDVVEITKGMSRPNEDAKTYSIENKTENQKLLAVFISED